MYVPAVLLGATIASFAAYLAYAGITWLGYGRTQFPGPTGTDERLGRFMPTYEVVQQHSIRVAAPVEVVFSAAMDCDLTKSRLTQALIKSRERILGGEGIERRTPNGFLAQMKSLGWGMLAEIPGREVVLGAVTKPWEANVVFRAVPADEFRDFREPGYVKIAWTLCAEPAGPRDSIARTETRVVTTDRASRRMFRRYWAFVSPGSILIRWVLLRQVKREAEQNFRSRGSQV